MLLGSGVPWHSRKTSAATEDTERNHGFTSLASNRSHSVKKNNELYIPMSDIKTHPRSLTW